jgi:hypothetical protein
MQPGRPLIQEWQNMTPNDQASQWRDLVTWVAWMYDLYELSREERLPLCWPQHPGLIEELRSLKAWRDLIYDTPDAVAVPYTARSWHGELRQSIAAAITFWAPGCRTGHKPATLLTAQPRDLATEWRKTGPPLMDSAPASGPTARAQAGVVAGADMARALADGTARRHSTGLAHYVSYQQTWWTRPAGSPDWLRCTDPDHTALLERTSGQLQAADAAHQQLSTNEDH